MWRAVPRPAVRPVEPDDVVDAYTAEERRHPAGALPNPVEPARCEEVPPVRRESPVLSGLTEGVRRDADGNVEQEFVGSRPDIRAVQIDDERHVAEDADAGRFGCGSRGLPLLFGQPLEILML